MNPANQLSAGGAGGSTNVDASWMSCSQTISTWGACSSGASPGASISASCEHGGNNTLKHKKTGKRSRGTTTLWYTQLITDIMENKKKQMNSPLPWREKKGAAACGRPRTAGTNLLPAPHPMRSHTEIQRSHIYEEQVKPKDRSTERARQR